METFKKREVKNMNDKEVDTIISKLNDMTDQEILDLYIANRYHTIRETENITDFNIQDLVYEGESVKITLLNHGEKVELIFYFADMELG